ncbi:hypothetical protein [Mycobacterium ostraviense]|nr:hypothetical protein [Mycobacterium ostraviense]
MSLAYRPHVSEAARVLHDLHAHVSDDKVTLIEDDPGSKHSDL